MAPLFASASFGRALRGAVLRSLSRAERRTPRAFQLGAAFTTEDPASDVPCRLPGTASPAPSGGKLARVRASADARVDLLGQGGPKQSWLRDCVNITRDAFRRVVKPRALFRGSLPRGRDETWWSRAWLRRTVSPSILPPSASDGHVRFRLGLDRASVAAHLAACCRARSRCVRPTSANPLLHDEHLRIVRSRLLFRGLRLGVDPRGLGPLGRRRRACAHIARRILADAARDRGTLRFTTLGPLRPAADPFVRRCSRCTLDGYPEPLTPLSRPSRSRHSLKG